VTFNAELMSRSSPTVSRPSPASRLCKVVRGIWVMLASSTTLIPISLRSRSTLWPISFAFVVSVAIRTPYGTHLGTSTTKGLRIGFQLETVRVVLTPVSPDPARDPYNTAVAAELKARLQDDITGIVRLSKLTGIPRATLGRYLNGERDIRVGVLRKIAAALNVEVGDILTEAERRL
jgi:DNA-binding Xre family transcriptional regulator